MSVSPDYAMGLARSVRDVYEKAEDRLIRTIAAQVAAGVQAESWQDAKLESITRLMREIDIITDELQRGAPAAVEKAIGTAYRRGIAVGGADLDKAGFKGSFGGAGRTDAITRLLGETMDTLIDAPQRIRRWARDTFDRATTDATGQLLTGTITRQQAARDAVKRLASEGVKTFTDKSGRNWELASYAEMATRTSSGRAMIDGHTQRLQDLGQDLVVVSDAPEECEICRPYEGEVLSVSGMTTGELSDGRRVLASLDDARADGLFHPNCRHSQSIYLPGVTETPKDTADPEGDQLRQRQRAYERRIRDWKRRVLIDEETLGKDDPKTKATRKKARAVQSEFKAWRADNDRKNVPGRTSLTSR